MSLSNRQPDLGSHPLSLTVERGASWRRRLSGNRSAGPSLVELMDRAMRMIGRPRSKTIIAVICKKGGSGKTTTAVNLANILNYAGVKTTVLDANSDGTTLPARVAHNSPYYLGQIFQSRASIQSWEHLQQFCAFTADDTPVLLAHRDDWSQYMDLNAYQWVLYFARLYSDVVVVDCGTDINNAVADFVLQRADHLVTVGNASLDELEPVQETLIELEERGYDKLVRDAVAVLGEIPKNSPLNIHQIHDDWTDRPHYPNTRIGAARTVVDVPYDPHLKLGGTIRMTDLQDETKVQYAVLAAAVAATF